MQLCNVCSSAAVRNAQVGLVPGLGHAPLYVALCSSRWTKAETQTSCDCCSGGCSVCVGGSVSTALGGGHGVPQGGSLSKLAVESRALWRRKAVASSWERASVAA